VSQENVEIVRRLYATWNSEDRWAVLSLVDPEAEAVLTGALNDGTYRGHAGVRQLLEEFWTQFEDQRTEVEECIDAGDAVFTSVVHRGRGKGSGVEVEWPQWQVFTLRDGKAVRWRLFSDRREALKAAGLAE
jgi:ketosteroid isomerase-like protein